MDFDPYLTHPNMDESICFLNPPLSSRQTAGVNVGKGRLTNHKIRNCSLFIPLTLRVFALSFIPLVFQQRKLFLIPVLTHYDINSNTCNFWRLHLGQFRIINTKQHDDNTYSRQPTILIDSKIGCHFITHHLHIKCCHSN